MTSDSWVLNIITFGYRLEFERFPSFNIYNTTPPSIHLQKEIHSLFKKNAIKYVPSNSHSGLFSRYFTVPKPDGSRRPILNLRGLNKFLVKRKFCMITLQQILPLLSPGDWFMVIDLTDAYYHVSIHPDHRRFLRFSVKGRCFQFRALPFGLSLAPRVFKCMAPVAAHLCSNDVAVFPYLDDWLLVSPSREKALRDLDFTLHLLHNLANQPPISSHKFPRTTGNFPCPPILQTPDMKQDGSHPNQQYDSSPLPQQTGWHLVAVASLTHSADLGVVLHQTHFPSGNSCPHSTKRLSQQVQPSSIQQP